MSDALSGVYPWLQGQLNDLGFMPHGHCFLWTPSLLRIMALADLGIALAYFVIPLVLILAMRDRRARELR